MVVFSFSVFLEDDNKMKDSATIRNNSYSLKNVLFPGQDQKI